MGWDVPAFGHLPMILGDDGKPLSKRHGSASVMDFAEAGYLPETMRNYLARLGWGHGDADIFSDAEAIEWFDVADVVSAPARFDKKKLDSVSQHYINVADNDRLADHLLPMLNNVGTWLEPGTWMGRFENEVIDRMKTNGARTLVELRDSMLFVFNAPTDLDEKAISVLADPAAQDRLGWAFHLLSLSAPSWTIDDLNHLIHAKAEDDGYKMKEIGPVLRVALTGKTSAPDLGTCLALIGRVESMRRIAKAMV
jgi:glutamyl-tRNA synthetase